MKTMLNNIKTQFSLIQLHALDKLFLVIFGFIVGWVLYDGLTALTFGGVLLIYSSFLTYKGQIFLAVGSYIMADLCWIYNAWSHGDYKGMFFISIGIVFGIFATYKMNAGTMERDLLKKQS